MFTMFTISHAYFPPPPPAHPPEPPYVPYPTGRDTLNSYIEIPYSTDVRQVQFDKTTNCIYFMGKGYNTLELYRTNITSGVTVLINSVNNDGEPTALAISYTHMKLFIAIGRKTYEGQGSNTLYHVSLPANNGDDINEKIASMRYDVNGMYAIGDYLYFSYSEYGGNCVTRTTIDPPTTDGFGSGCFQNINDAIAVSSNNDDTLYVLSGKERSVYKVNLTDSSPDSEIVISSIYSSAYPTVYMGTMAVSQTTIYIQLTNELLMYDVNSFRLLRRIKEDYMSIYMGSYFMFYGSITFNEENLVFLGATSNGILQLNFNEGPSPPPLPPLPPSAPPLPPSLDETRIKTLEDQVAELQSLIVNSTGTCGDLRRIYAESACCGLDDSAAITCASS